MVRAENVAMAFAPASVGQPPLSVPTPWSASVIEAPDTLLPNASSARTCTPGDMIAPAATPVGWTTNESVAAAAGATVNALLPMGVSAPEDAESCFEPARLTCRFVNVAMPPASLGMAPPPVSTPPPWSASVTDAPATPFPCASTTFTWTAGVRVAPAVTFEGCTTNWSAAAAPAFTVNELLVAGESPPPDAVSCFEPERLMPGPGKLATPEASLSREPPPVSAPVPTSASETDVPWTPLPNASATFTCTAGVIVAPAVTVVGWTVNESAAAAPAEMVNEVLVTRGSAPLEARSCFEPARLMPSFGNVAMPQAALGDAPPPVSAPVPSSASVTEAPLTPFPSASVTFTCTAGVSVTPAAAFEGWTTNWSADAAPA